MSDYIVEDNLALILRWVPVKTLLQVRCVCKGWKEIIDSPLFIREHLSLQKVRFLLQKPRFFLEKGSPECSVLDPHALPSVHMLNGPTEDHGYLFIGTHNGVVCLFNYSTRSNLLLWNPSIRMFLTVPIPKYKDSGWKYFEGQDCFGFWIDPSSKEYKFVIVNSILDKKGKPAGSVVYSSIRQDWRVIPAVEVGSWMPRPTVMIHGVAHWRGNRSEGDAGIILSFDFIHERFDLIEMPDLKFSLDEPIHCHWQGHLAVVVRDRKSSDRYIPLLVIISIVLWRLWLGFGAKSMIVVRRYIEDIWKYLHPKTRLEGTLARRRSESQELKTLEDNREPRRANATQGEPRLDATKHPAAASGRD